MSAPAAVLDVKNKAETKAIQRGYPDYFFGKEPAAQSSGAPATEEPAKKKRKKAKVHLKVDTGMGRLGVPFHLFSAFLRETQKLPGIEIEGLLSHFSMTDEEESYTSSQWEKFQQAITQAKEMGVSSRYVHIANSATSTAFPAYSGNLIRPGIMLYGSYPSLTFEKRVQLKPVLTLKTRIHFLKLVPTGTRIRYGGTFVTRRESVIATLPIGYADGYSTRLSNHGEVLIRGKRVPIAGKVCMDLIMADVTDIPGVSKGDEAILMSFSQTWGKNVAR